MSILQQIVDKKRERLSAARHAAPLTTLRAICRDREEARDFAAALDRQGGPIRFITEIKKASPSKGLIRSAFDPIAIAVAYQSHGADAISVITEEDFFQGALDFLAVVRSTVTTPVLRKDFIIDEYQVFEARANDADALLLIAAILEKGLAHDLYHLARELGMGVLFEVHDEEELAMALDLSMPIIGVNNRNLNTMQIDLNTSLRLRTAIPNNTTMVCESGIRNRDDVLRMEAAGVDALLVGTRLMESPDIGAELDKLKGVG